MTTVNNFIQSLINNPYIILLAIILIAVIIYVIKKGKKGIYAAALYLVTVAEEEWGSKTGQIKFAEVLSYVNYPSPKGNGLLRALRLYLRSLIAYAILILIGVSTSPLLYRALRLTTLLLRIIFNAPFTSALRYLPTLVLYIPLCIRLPLN